ncbi:hypothetical protein LXL04_010377 [Taraxacum kok-saghyz]
MGYLEGWILERWVAMKVAISRSVSKDRSISPHRQRSKNKSRSGYNQEPITNTEIEGDIDSGNQRRSRCGQQPARRKDWPSPVVRGLQHRRKIEEQAEVALFVKNPVINFFNSSSPRSSVKGLMGMAFSGCKLYEFGLSSTITAFFRSRPRSDKSLTNLPSNSLHEFRYSLCEIKPLQSKLFNTNEAYCSIPAVKTTIS